MSSPQATEGPVNLALQHQLIPSSRLSRRCPSPSAIDDHASATPSTLTTPSTTPPVPASPAASEASAAACPIVHRRRWTEAADYLLLKEVRAAQAYISPWGKMTEHCMAVALQFNRNSRAPFKKEHKHAKDRMHLIAWRFEVLDERRANATTAD